MQKFIRESSFPDLTFGVTSFIFLPLPGYIVMCTNLALLHCTGMAFLVQSAWLRPEGIAERIAGFLEEYVGNADKHLTEAEFEKLKASVISLLEEKPKHIKEEASR